jgi:hypothetical protein
VRYDIYIYIYIYIVRRQRVNRRSEKSGCVSSGDLIVNNTVQNISNVLSGRIRL